MSNTTTQSKQATRFITCGMYAFTDQLRVAWQKLFDCYSSEFESFAVDRNLKFGSGKEMLRDPQLFVGHTCGYPLMHGLQDDLTPVCVPLFDVAGCDGKYYASQFIVGIDSNIESLADCYQRVAAMNDTDSNSGMNLLRHAIAVLSEGKPYFSKVLETGSHFQSFVDVAERRADIAAIDCVSYQLIVDNWPDMAARVRSIGFSESTCGLPFVMPKSLLGVTDKKDITTGLNKAVLKLAGEFRDQLHLLGFEQVDIEDYQGIVDLETSAQQLDYPLLS
ncbi:MAG: phosphate ABC transporter substrate-binding protein [Gammaproteobacteria bacterium]|nr:MAG: phosphate ABC transporter substrate-binding protein [Gammaproteobacteria bacterium]